MVAGKTVLPSKDKLGIFYSTTDRYPPFRADIVELFTVQLARQGVKTAWYMKRSNLGHCGEDLVNEQKVRLPWLVDVSYIGFAINKLGYWLCDAVSLLSIRKGEFNIIQVRDKYFAALVGWIAAKKTRSVFTCWLSYPFPEHDMEMARNTRGLKKLMFWLRGLFGYIWLYKFIYRLADHVFVQSEQMLQDVAGYGVPREKMTPVPMGVPPRLLDWVGTDEGKKIVPGKVVYVGTLARVRRLGVVIEAFALVHKCNPDAHLFMVGDGDIPAERAELEALVRLHGLMDAVTFTGFIPMEQAWAQAASAEVCLSPIFPSRVLNGGSPTKLVEYMALGRPVVANDHPEQAAILRESGAGLCVPWGAESFAGAIFELLANPEKAQAMGARGSAWVAANRTYDKLAAQVYERYRDLLDEKL